MTNRSGTLYIGVTNDLLRRVHEHKTKCIEGFTAKYNLTQLVYYEGGADIREAIAREKQLKGWRRSKKLALINSFNSTWDDLSEAWFDMKDRHPEDAVRGISSGMMVRYRA